MAFDSKGFMAVVFTRRESFISVSQLSHWFEDGEDAVWKIQSLKGAELGKCDEAANNRKFAEDLLEGLLHNITKEAIEEVKNIVGRIAEKSFEFRKRIYMLHFASVEPKCPLNMAVRIADEFPILFLFMTNKILELTGEGSSSGKSKPSGTTPK